MVQALILPPDVILKGIQSSDWPMRPILIWILIRLLVTNARGVRGWFVCVPVPGARGCSLAEAGSASLLSALHVLHPNAQLNETAHSLWCCFGAWPNTSASCSEVLRHAVANGLELHPLGWPETAVSSGCACLRRNLLSGLVVCCGVPERCCSKLGRPMASPHCDALSGLRFPPSIPLP